MGIVIHNKYRIDCELVIYAAMSLFILIGGLTAMLEILPIIGFCGKAVLIGNFVVAVIVTTSMYIYAIKI